MRVDPDQLAALRAILRLGTFEAAAAELSVTPSAVSQRIKALEDRTGGALIQRGAPCTATSMGARLAKHAEDVSLLESHLARDLGLDAASESPTVLRIAVNADSVATWFLGALAEVPDMLYDLVLDDQDHSADWLRQGAVSAAVTARQAPVTGCDAHDLGALRYIPTASPAFLRRHFPDGVTPASLARAPCLTFSRKDMLQRQWIEARAGRRLSPPCHYLPSSHAFVDAAIAALGWGMNPESLVRDPIRRGDLLPLVDGTPLDVPLCWQVSRIMAPALRPLTEAVRAAAARSLIPR